MPWASGERHEASRQEQNIDFGTFLLGGAPGIIEGHFGKKGTWRLNIFWTFVDSIRDPPASHLGPFLNVF